MKHDDDPLGLGNEHGGALQSSHGERRTRWVVALTAAMMVTELVVGQLTGSMSLLADGWHMATHVGAIGLAALAYWFARSRANSRAFTFGTGKVYALAGYTSAVALALVAVLMCVESAARLRLPVSVKFDEALVVAVIGLLVNLASALLLGHHDHDHEDETGDGAPPRGAPDHHHDHNLRAAYVHVLADALTSVLAIGALLAGKYANLPFLDPAMGIVGGLIILRWAWQLARDAGTTLLDAGHAAEEEDRVRALLERDGEAKVVDLHVWELGPGRRGCVVAVVANEPKEPVFYRDLIRKELSVSHLTVEVHRSANGA